MEYKWAPVKYLLENGLLELTKKSWEECWKDNGCLEYNPDWKAHEKMEENNIERTLGAFVNDILVGYACVILAKDLLDRNKYTAHVHAFFLDHEYRKGFNGINFIKYLEGQLKTIKAHRIIIAHRFKKDNRESLLFKRLKYEHQENLMVKNLLEV